MNKLLIFVVAIAVAAGGLFYFLKQQDQTPGASDAQSETQNNTFNNNQEGADNAPEQPVTGSGQAATLAEIAEGGAKKCELTVTISSENPELGDYQGNFYSDGAGRYHTEIWQLSQPETKFYTLVSSPWVYTWTSFDNRGIRTAASTAGQAGVPGSEFDPNSAPQPYDFDCSSWSVNQSMFEPPANITFSEMPQFAQ